ncbi:cache domain-containing sensor histidine kinase [Paenibacillus mendelii]|uniref:histidine kinase n=1 Tax=Paenibacillus mendelii TaxID=206163 RepID=A0ABV6JKG4_9BACL|nr:histidine kinase [Paenibacillus mendelii]MCQ6563071.1 sensor histidine kinase [Paenibacillus mendelii]
MKRAVYGVFNRLRFNQKLFLSYLIVIIIPILVLGIYSYRQSKEMQNIQASQSIERNVEAVSESIKNSLEEYDQMIRSIVLNRTFQRIVANDYLDLINLSRDLKEYLSPYVNMMMMMNNHIHQITFYTQSDVPEYGLSVLKHERVMNQPWYQKVLEGTEYQWFFDESGYVSVAGKFPRFFSDTYTNVVYMRIEDKGLFKNILDLAKGYSVIISDENNRVLYVNSSEAKAGMPAYSTGDILHLKDGLAVINGTKMFVVNKTIPQTQWVIRCFVPMNQVTQNADSILGATLIVIGSCIVFLLIIISIFSKTMIRRIYKLNTLMKRVENGELMPLVQSASKDEIGELTNRFGNMLVRINALIEEAYTNKIIQKELELKALQSQINPHFLYNTLSFINWEALKNEQHITSHVVTALSRFYRTSLNKGDSIIQVRDELDNIKSYLDIIRIMSDGGFEIHYEIDEAVYDYWMINLILQPLVENAVRHGINQREDGGGGVLRVSARLTAGSIIFTVEDNGPGMNEEMVVRLLSVQSSGYGLKNVNERLKLFFGIASRIEIESVIGRGTIMKVTIPQYVKSE